MNLPIISREVGDLNPQRASGPVAQRVGSALMGAAMTRNHLWVQHTPGSIVGESSQCQR
jgi:hypothetical protein